MKFNDSETNPSGNRTAKWLVGIGLLLGLGVLFSLFRPPPPEIVLPHDLDQLEPQLQAYLEERIQWVAKAPREGNRQATLGTIYAVNGLWNEALGQFDNARSLDPNQPLAHLYHAVALQETGEPEQALEALRHLCRIYPQFPQGFARLGQALLKIGALEEAESAFERLILLQPQEWRGHAGLGDVLLKRDDPKEALSHLQKARELAPHEGVIRHLLGLAYQRTNQPDAARRELEAGEGAVYYPMPDPWSLTAPQHLQRLQDQFSAANDYIDAGQADRALPILLQAAQWHPENKSLLVNLARAHLALDQLNEARQSLDKILSQDPQNLSALVMAAETYLNLGLENQAEQFARQAVRSSPEAPPAHLSLATILINTERVESGLKSYQQARAHDPQNPLIAMEIGDILLRLMARPKQALASYLEAAALDPNLFLVQVRLADIYIRLSQAEAATASLNRARQLSPNDRVLNTLQRRLDQLLQGPFSGQ